LAAGAAKLYFLSPPKAAEYFTQIHKILLNADFVTFGKQKQQNQRFKKYSLAANAANRL
jgi:hypothetical protein